MLYFVYCLYERRQMKIFILVYNLTNGGAERVAALWAKGFSLRGYQVNVVIGDDRSPVTYAIPDNVKLDSICSHKRIKLFRAFDRIRKLRQLICRENPDLIIGLLNSRALWAYIATLDRNIPIVNTEHNVFDRPDSAPMPFNVKVYKYFVNRLYQKVTILTQADKDFIGDKLKNVVVLPNPLAFAQIEESKLTLKKHVLLASGRLNAWHVKGFDNLIRAWGIVKKEIDTDWVLKIAGQGTNKDLSFLRNLCEKYAVQDSTQFIGYTSKLYEYYQEASIFVLSSRYEGFGMVLIEAMSQGCACIACDYKGRQKEIIPSDKEGVICPADNVELLAEAIMKIITNDELRQQLQRQAISRSSYYNLDKTMDRWEDIINSIKSK